MFVFRVDNEIELRLWEHRYAEQLFTLTDKNRDYLREWLGWVDNTKTVSDSESFMKTTLHQFANNDGFAAGIWYKGELAGSVGLHFIDWAERKTEIGYWLGADFQGRGIMSRTCRAVLDYAFNELKLNKVTIQAATENTKSRRIPEKLGFSQEGIDRQAEWLYDHFVDLVAYSMLAKNWSNKK